MQIADILDIERVNNNVDVQSKKRALEELSRLIVNNQPQLDSTVVFDSLISRERLGTTCVGHGIAIPHGRISDCNKITGAMIQLVEGVDFDAVDNQPVDILFALAVPEESNDEHLQVLAQLAKMFSNDDFRQRLRAAKSSEELYQIVTDWKAD